MSVGWHAVAIAVGRLDWTREEIILAMDLYVTVDAPDGGPFPRWTPLRSSS
jgi:hypothetical protein